MNLSEETKTILKNFAMINPSILIEPGNKLKVFSPTDTVYAEAFLPDEFPKEAGIADVIKFLSIIGMDKSVNPNLDFKNDFLEIKFDRGSTIEYSYCDPAAFNHAKGRKITVKNPLVTFSLSKEVLDNTLKAMSILRLQEVAIVGKGGKLSLETISTTNSLSDKFYTVIGETDKNFVAIIDAKMFKMLPQDYTVSLAGGNSPIAEFKGEQATYCIALSMESHFDDYS